MNAVDTGGSTTVLLDPQTPRVGSPGHDRRDSPRPAYWSDDLIGGRAHCRRLLPAVAVAGALIALGVAHFAAIEAGAADLADADAGWLALGGLGTAALWLVGTATVLGSIPVRPPLGRALAVQIAGSFANTLLPAGSGGIAINLRFLRRHGFSRGEAAAAVALNALAGLATHLVLLVAVISAQPAVSERLFAVAPWRRVEVPHGRLWVALAAVAAVMMWLLFVIHRGPGAEPDASGIGRGSSGPVPALRGLRGSLSVAGDPWRVAALWLGSLAMPLLHSLILFAVLRSLGVDVAVGAVLVTYIVVSAGSAVVPSVGGLGAFDVMLLAGLVAVGMTSSAALAAVIGYRLITVWAPLLPGACVLAVLVRRRVI